MEYKPQVKPLCHQKIQEDVVFQKPKFLININESKNCITFSNSECSYTLNIFNSGHYHFLLDNNLIYLITDYSGLLLHDHHETRIIKKLKEELDSYVTKYNYNIYILNKEIYRNVAFIPNDVKIMYDSTSGLVEIKEDCKDMIKSIITIENKLEDKYDITDFYNKYGFLGFEIINYMEYFGFLKNNNIDNELWFELYKMLNSRNKEILINYLAA